MDLSIIIPTYNRLWSLPAAIASLPRSDRIEVIVVDDGSTDGSWDWLGAQPGIIAIRQANWGKAAAVNAGFERATGRYVRFLDSDDQLVVDAVLAQLERTLAVAPDICAGSYQEVDGRTGRRTLHRWVDCGDFLAQQLGECDSSHYSAYLFRRHFLDDIRHRPEFAFRDDRMFILECALRAPRVLDWDIPTLIHFHHDRPRVQFQLGSSAVVTSWQELRMWRTIHAQMNAHGLQSARRDAAMTHNLWALALRVGATHPREGRAIVDWLKTLDPSFTIPATGINRLYRALGHAPAQVVVNAARATRNGVRAISALRRAT